AEGTAAHQPHHQVRPVAVRSVVEHGRHSPMVHARHRPALVPEPPCHLAPIGAPRHPRKLDGDVTTPTQVPALPHLAHRTACQRHPAELVLFAHGSHRTAMGGFVASTAGRNPTTTKVLPWRRSNTSIRRYRGPVPAP